jgi:hypothetical protein
MHGNIITASLLAILSAVNRAVAQGALPRGDADAAAPIGTALTGT